MSQDVSSEVAGLISGSKVFGASDNIRHGKYKLLVERIHAQMVETDKGNHKMAFWEFRVLEAHPNPQSEGDRVDYVGPGAPGVGPLRDDGRNPNSVGSRCALKVDFDGAGGRSAGANIKAAILALFGKRDGEIPDDEVNKTWVDLARVKDLKVGDAIGIDGNNQPVLAQKAKQANPACGAVIWCDTMVKKKKQANEKGAYVTKLMWDCKGNPFGVGENSAENIAKRRVEVEATRTEEGDDEDNASSTPSPYAAVPAPAPAPQMAPPAPAPAPIPVVAAPPPPPPAPAPTVAAFVPPPPWRVHPNYPGYYWDGNQGVKSEAQLRAGA